jgi:hypothetical protein
MSHMNLAAFGAAVGLSLTAALAQCPPPESLPQYGGRTDVGEIACEVGLLGDYVWLGSGYPGGNVNCQRISTSRENCHYLFSIDPRLTDNHGACEMSTTVHWWTSYGTL